MIDDGYSGVKEGDESHEPIEFKLMRLDFYFHGHGGGNSYNITRNGIPVGLVRCKSKQEGEWLAKRINGTFNPTEHE